MKTIITQFLQKQNPKLFLLRFGLTYSAILSIIAIIFQQKTFGVFTPHHHTVELLLIAAITAYLQTLICYAFLAHYMKKGRFK